MFSATDRPFDTLYEERDGEGEEQEQDTRTSSHSVKAAKEMRQLKFTEPGSDRNPTQRKDARNKQKLAINIVLERSVTLAFRIGQEKHASACGGAGASKPVGRVH